MERSFPDQVWNGQSGARDDVVTDRPPDNLDWNRIIAELSATQAYLLALNEIVQNMSGGGGSPGGSAAQIQFNNGDGTFAAFRGNALVNDSNGLTDAVAIGDGSYALGEQSLASGNGCVASTDYSVALGYQSTAGDTPRACTISGTTVTISGDQTFWFYDGDDGALVLSNLSGGSGPTIVYASIVDGGVVFDDPNTVITLKTAITSHTSGFANMRDDATGCFSFGFNCSSIGGLALGSHCSSVNNSLAVGFSCTASGNQSCAIGDNSQAPGNHSASLCQGNSTSGDSSFAIGYNNIASGNYSYAEGTFTTASGVATHAGGNNSTASLLCQWARSDGGAIAGQESQLYLQGQTTTDTPVNLLIGGTAYPVITQDRAVAFIAKIIAYQTDGSNVAAFMRMGLITNVGGTTAIVGSTGTISADINSPGWSVEITADDLNDALQVAVTGAIDTTINWRCTLFLTEVGVS